MSSMSGPHDWVISGYLDGLGLEVSDNEALRRRRPSTSPCWASPPSR